MRRSIRRILVALALVVAVAASARAADTGTVSGAVFNERGELVVDAMVRISGDPFPVGRTTQTGSNGTYRFDYLPPGEYVVEIVTPLDSNARRPVLVEVGKDTQVDLVIGLTFQEQVVVTAARPIVDVRSTEVAFNYQADTLNALPLERTYRGMLQLIPGVADNRSPVGLAAGGSRQDNTYLIDGANVTNPSFGELSTEINELDIAEVNLKRAGISAEFGRTGGTVTNAVSRSGSNTFMGLARIDWLGEKLVGAYRLPDDLVSAGVRPGAFRDALLTSEASPAVGIGGPIVRDRLYFYASVRYSRETKWSRFNKAGTALPDEIQTGPELFGKATAAPGASHQLSLSYRHRPSHVENDGLGADYAPSVATTTDNGSRIATTEWSYFVSPRSSVNLRYLHSKEINEGVPVVDLGFLPRFDPANPGAMGQYTDPAQANLVVGASQYANTQNYRRHEVRGTFTRFFEMRRTSHTFKAGAGYEFAEEMLDRIANGWGIVVPITVSGVPALRTRYYAAQPAQRGQGRTASIFVQDSVLAGNRTSFTIGVLLNRDEFAQHVTGSGGCPNVPLKGGAAVYESSGDTCTFLRFGFGSEVQPRLGVSHQLRSNAGDKVYANWGRYYNMDQKSSGRSLAPNRIFQTQTVFDLDGAVLSSGPLASTTGKLIDPEIEPIYADEVLFGYATPIGDRYSVDVFFMSREMKRFIEDVPSRLGGSAPNSGPFVATNLPCAAFAACQSAHARRTYRAVTIDVRRRLAGRWMADVSYTWSRFEGNFDLDYATVGVFNTSSIIQDGPGTNVEDPNRYGPLFEDRPHIVKAFASYAPGDRLGLSGYLRIQSGTPWAARGRDWEGAVLNYLEPAGTHRNPTWTNLDVMASYRVYGGGRTSVSLETRALNVFDNQTRLSTDAQQYLDLRTIPAPPYFAPYLQPNPFFGTGNSFAPPRRLYLAAVARF